ncbi:Ig-like domain-containing protein [Pontibacter sp. Tf4]|uniref:Ig-like domain-containing domain n=1 Tax=Pontibacter sp. Tf4 TaxID=2761620 RepID=UPI0016236B1E|nr:Ig-like domain-containing domain [Pontibacter sp. Tf4]MBB6609577.1 Ig-like domain-containing protein [Pontibacter sp. Tf4]
MRFINTALAAATALVTAGCASVGSPEGGPKDTTPPTLVSSNPTNQQLNVNTNTISLEFNENVQPISVQKELLITPFTDNKYRIRFKDNNLSLIFDKPLQDSTTYIFNFRNGIADITEKNVAKGLRLSFSTGSYIDSSRVSGKVLNLLTQEPEKDAVVALYRANDTLDIRKSRPYYQIQANAQGEYSLENVKEGTYKIFALQDANTNSLYEEIERIGFKAEPITVTPDSQYVVLQTARIDTKKPIGLQRQKFLDRFAITYTEGISRITAKTIGSADTVSSKIAPDGKIAELFRSPKFNGGKLLVAVLDSAGNSSLDTIQVDFGTDYTQRVQGAQLKVINGNQQTQTYRPGQKLTIALQGQVKINGANPISIQADSVNKTSLKYPEQINLDKTQTELTFTVPKLAARQQPYSIVIDSTQLVPVHNKKFPIQPIPLTIAEAQGFGSVKGTIAGNQQNFILQLLTTQNKVLKEVRNQRNFHFTDLPPNSYKLRVIRDENNNGKWDQGSADFKKEPEQIYMHPDLIEIRANWDLEDIRIQL